MVNGVTISTMVVAAVEPTTAPVQISDAMRSPVERVDRPSLSFRTSISASTIAISKYIYHYHNLFHIDDHSNSSSLSLDIKRVSSASLDRSKRQPFTTIALDDRSVLQTYYSRGNRMLLELLPNTMALVWMVSY